MIPLRSSERTYSQPTITLSLIVVNFAVFLYEFALPGWQLDRFILHYGLVPDRFHYSQLLTSMFVHGGWLHVIGNMWFFGRNIEDLLGHVPFLLFYLTSGIAAGLAQVLIDPYSRIPTVGASGAIAGVMGAYLVKYPRARIVTLVFIFFFITTFDLPAAFLLIYWFAIQFFSGVGSIGYSQASSSNIAFFAHVGGFIAGMLLILVIPAQRRYKAWY
jgi:membrane associated rhomboid family serine protease